MAQVEIRPTENPRDKLLIPTTAQQEIFVRVILFTLAKGDLQYSKKYIRTCVSNKQVQFLYRLLYGIIFKTLATVYGIVQN